MKRLVLVIRAHKGDPRMKASSANKSQNSKGWFAVQGNIPRNFVDMDKHYKNIGHGRVLKYLRRKLLPLH